MTDLRPSADWLAVLAALTAEIREGVLTPGTRLATEPALMSRFGAGRHSVRRAIAALEAEGLVRTRQGSGTYVREAPVLNYRLSGRTRFSQNLLEQGREPSGRVLGVEDTAAPPGVAEALRLPPGEPVFRVRHLGLADGVPVDLSDACYPARRFPGMAEAWAGAGGASAVLAGYGITDYRRVSSTVLARLPSAEEARLLDQPAAQPVLVVRKVDADTAGVPIAFSETLWAGQRVQLLVDHATREESLHVDR
ncbi:phosphonate metabolism transcriptional regulator PhnF [Muricoccus pecuniae]|uniref:GntR family phosphonate transport system transcriptional regulator n=1 Tax=Muricoccus pecuniae TaxID=693023 RepID=A0A840XZ55_9PROT|nr:phosphonate metabolism transcriptional regulator PhnF [Roseomonas pecuniae]MBB5694108.1 GntR family phosphonate transport system transcriptional regulator [Roseomonas pecuniae]